MADERDINALRHYVARLEDELAEEQYQHGRTIIKLENAREHISDQALDIVTLGQEVGRLREALTMFTMFYPFGISLELDQAFRTARAALAKKEEK